VSGETPAGATPAVDGATPSQTTPVSPAPAAAPADASPATDDTDALGDKGKAALDRMKTERDADRAARKALEKELADLRATGLSETERAIAKAKQDGAAEVTTRWSSQVRRSEVKAALTSEGINPSLLDLAVGADAFAELKVTDEGEVEGLADAIKAFKAAKPDLFTRPPMPGTADGGTRGKPTLTKEVIKGMTTSEINARWDEVQKALAS
jgi:hypothetical protein